MHSLLYLIIFTCLQILNFLLYYLDIHSFLIIVINTSKSSRTKKKMPGMLVFPNCASYLNWYQVSCINAANPQGICGIALPSTARRKMGLKPNIFSFFTLYCLVLMAFPFTFWVISCLPVSTQLLLLNYFAMSSPLSVLFVAFPFHCISTFTPLIIFLSSVLFSFFLHSQFLQL